MTEVQGVCDCAVDDYWKCPENRGCYAHAANKLRQPHRRGVSNLRFALSRKYQTNHPPYSRKKSDMNDVRETGLVLSNSVLHMRIVTIPSRLHARSVFLWPAHYGYLITTFYILLR
jgi:hypothetical protein